jgi:hypothetical protein
MAAEDWSSLARKRLEKEKTDKLLKETEEFFSDAIDEIREKTLDEDTTKTVEAETEQLGLLNFSIIDKIKLDNIYKDCKEIVIAGIKDYLIFQYAPKGATIAGEETLARINLKKMYLVYAFIHILRETVYDDYDELEIKKMFQYVYHKAKNEFTFEILDLIISIVLYQEPNFKCTKWIKKPNLRQNKCINEKLLSNNIYIPEDEALVEMLELNKTAPAGRKMFLSASQNNLNKLLRPYKFEEIEEHFQNVIYTTLHTSRNGMCEYIEVPGVLFGTNERRFTNVKIEFGIDLDTHKFVIFRWGRWREFDPINYVIKTDISGYKTKDKELRKNPFSNRVYQGTPHYYHTVLRMLNKICGTDTNNDEKVFYYSIIHRTFFREGDCEPVKLYSGVGNERAGCNNINRYVDCGDIKEKFEHNSNFKINIAKEILQTGNASCHNRDEFLVPFVQEFYGAMDEITESDKINIVEKMIFDNDNEERKQTIENYNKQPGKDEEREKQREEQVEVLARLRNTLARKATKDAAAAAERKK